MDERGKDNFRVSREKMGLGELAEKVCGVYGLQANELRAGSRYIRSLGPGANFQGLRLNCWGMRELKWLDFLGLQVHVLPG